MTSAIAETACQPAPTVTPIYLRPWVPLLAGATVLTWCYRDSLAALPEVWATDPNSSHGYLVPAVSLYFAWQAWRDHGWPIRTEIDGGQVLAGVSRIAIAWIVHCICLLVPQFEFFDVLSLLLAFSGLLILLGGRAGYRPYVFALWFLAFAARLPEVFYQWLVLRLQEGASVVAAAALDTFFVPVVREGNYLHLPGHVLEVGAGCSGLRGLIGTFALALAVGQLVRGGRWFRWTLVALAFPVALAANSLRIILTGVLAYQWGPRFIQGVWHDMEGLVTTSLGMGLLFAAVWLLSRAYRNL
jgi:exosortase